jgi:hypothetical protein
MKTHDSLPITSEDILFGILDESLRKIEPIVGKFMLEGHTLQNMSVNVSYSEKLDFIKRVHEAKRISVYFVMS